MNNFKLEETSEVMNDRPGNNLDDYVRKPRAAANPNIDLVEEKTAMHFFKGFEKQANLGKEFAKGLLGVEEFTKSDFSKSLGRIAQKGAIGGATAVGGYAVGRKQRTKKDNKNQKTAAEIVQDPSTYAVKYQKSELKDPVREGLTSGASWAAGVPAVAAAAAAGSHTLARKAGKIPPWSLGKTMRGAAMIGGALGIGEGIIQGFKKKRQASEYNKQLHDVNVMQSGLPLGSARPEVRDGSTKRYFG